MKTILLVVALCATALLVRAQDVEAPQLNLNDLGFTGTASDSVLALTDNRPLWGWNWPSADGNVSGTMGMNFHHTHDPFTWNALGDWRFNYTRVPHQRLATTISGIGNTPDTSITLFMLPTEGIAMEWQPWLVMAGDTFTLRPDDSTGGVWGFGHRHSSGTVVQPTDDNRYRYRLETSGFSGSTLVLSDVERKDALTRWPNSRGKANLGYNTDTLWLAINLRRNDASSDVGHEDDVVLRVRVPYWRASDCWDNMGDSALARFLWIPRTANGRESVTSSLGQARGDRWQVDSAQVTTTEITITRRMLPQTTDTECDITIYAGLVFDYRVTADMEHMKPHNNPYFNTHTGTDLTRIRHIGVDVFFEDNLGVDVAYVRLESSEARNLFWGEYDMEIRDAVDQFMTRMRIFNLDSVPVAGEQPRLWRMYGRDEIRPMHWKGFRYMNRLLHDYVTTEWEVSEYNKSRHCLRLREYWQGQDASFVFHDRTASPTFRYGGSGHIGTMDTLKKYVGLWKGRADQPDFETHTYYYKDSNSCGDVINLQRRSPLPIHADSVHLYTTGYSGGVQTRVDYALHKWFYKDPDILFNPTRKWYSNVWVYSSADVYPANNAHGRRLYFTSNGRPKSAEEMRLQMWHPLVLGAKGLIFFSGTTDRAPANSAVWENPTTETTIEFGCAAHTDDVATVTAVDGVDRINSDLIGTDYLQAGEAGDADDYVANGLAATSAALHGSATGAPGVYVGRKAMRQVMLEVLHGITPFSDVLDDLQLVGWRAKGFREWFLGDSTTAYDHWLWRHRDSQRVGKLAVTVLHGTTPIPVSEPYDSTFFDVTVFRAGDTAITDVAYVGVVNRRTDPRVDTADGGDFRTYEEFKDYVDNEPDSLFAQHGSRRIRLPFRYDHSSGRYHNLRVTELRADSGWGVATNTHPRIDTIIGQDKPLDVDLLPGEGKIFRVTPVPATQETGAQGFLAHSNQRKMVLFPEVDTMITVTDTVTSRTYGRIVVGDSMWYHMVYHRRPVPDGPLTVYYRRSVPYSTNNHPDSSNFIFRNSTIDWEQEINVSDRVVGELFMPVGDDTMSFSAGYPALVVRYDSLEQMSKVYIVYAFERLALSFPTPDVLGIAEAVLPAEVTHADQVAYLAANAPRVFELVYGNEEDGLPSMWNYGTPMINASRFGNFYCWSSRVSGIRVGFKRPHERTFQPTGGIMTLPRLTTDYAAHPSMNSYSRLNIGEEDAAVVWHEGITPENGSVIGYTRLRFNGAAIENFLTLGQLTTPPVNPWVQSTFDTVTTTRIARLTSNGYYPVFYGHSYPSLFRNLSDYPITTANTRFDLGLDNHKGERVWWQAEKNVYLPGLPVISTKILGRRWFDVEDWTTCCSSNTPPAKDSIHAGQQAFLEETNRKLLGPEISQGEQTTETGTGVPNPTGAWWGDSVNTVTFWSVDGSNANHALHHMQFGWNYYGSPNTHQADTLRSRNYLYDLSDPGLYPHAAARYSMSVHPGWSKNRRIYNDLGGHWKEGSVAPDITFSSERFFRETVPRERSLRLWHGFRGHDGRSATIADAVLDGDNHPLRFDVRSENETPTDVVDEVATEWFSLDGSTELTMKTISLGEADAALLSVERRSDGARVLVDGAMRSATNTTGTNTTGTTQNLARTVAFGLLPDPDEQYRLVLKRTGEVYPVEDIEIVTGDGDMAREITEPLRIVDLRSMDGITRASRETGLSVWPNPASTHVTVVVDRRHNVLTSARTTKSGPRYMVTLRDITGRDIFAAPCSAIDIVHFDVSELPAGSYAITLSAVDGSAAPVAHQLVVITR